MCACVRVCVCVRERGRDYALTSLISQGLELEKDSKAIVRLDLHGVLRERERKERQRERERELVLNKKMVRR